MLNVQLFHASVPHITPCYGRIEIIAALGRIARFSTNTQTEWQHSMSSEELQTQCIGVEYFIHVIKHLISKQVFNQSLTP